MRYWTFFINSQTGWWQVIEVLWKGDMVDLRRARGGHIYTNKKEATRACRLKRKRVMTMERLRSSVACERQRGERV